MSQEAVSEVQAVEESLRRRLSIGSSVPLGKIVQQMVLQVRAAWQGRR